MLAKIGTSHTVNTNAIRSIEGLTPDSKGRERQQITFTDGSTLLVLSSEEFIDKLTGQVVPAPTGYTVIEAYPPEDGETEPTFRFFPVIAFRVMTIDNVMPPEPITAAGEPENTWALIWPDGQCERQHERIYDSVDAFKAHFRQHLDDDRQRAQAGAP